MKFKFFGFAFLAVTVLALTACSGENATEEKASNTIQTQNIKELVSDYSTGKIATDSASITSEQLIVTDSDGSESVYDLPEDEFFVSIAPYINQTHP